MNLYNYFYKEYSVLRSGKKLKKAFTLLEVSIVLALVAIISVVTVSLCVLFSRRTKDSANKLDIMQELILLRTVVSSWADEYSDQNIIDNFSFNDDVLSYNGIDKTYSFNQFYQINLELKENDGDKLYICRVICKNNEVHVFTVNSYIGEGIS